jgi:16S rRNA G966 N2-methylase RsmD
MKSRALGQGLLRETDLLPKGADTQPEGAKEFGVDSGHPRRLPGSATIRLQTMRHPSPLPEHVAVKRSDPIYNAHSYLTKVPIAAIRPFIETFTVTGDTVLDPFAGSGMTGVAAAILGRRAILRDINVLGQHVGTNYVNLVDREAFRDVARKCVEAARDRVGEVYATRCARCGSAAELSRTTWSVVCECDGCGHAFNFYRELERADWSKARMACPECGKHFNLRGAPRIAEEPVVDTVFCECKRTLQEQEPTPLLNEPRLESLTWPDEPIGADRQMFQASALSKNKLTTTASFFSDRNLAALAALRSAIDEEHDSALRDKLLFAFTAILARASKRYQWSRKRPLNAAHQHYYIAPVFYEWNVFDLFGRKIEAALRADDFLRTERDAAASLHANPAGAALEVEYEVGSADDLDLPDESIDYVFTDPPFGSNIFYSDMSLFQEAWLGRMTDPAREAVVDRSGNGTTRRTAERYERLVADALRECHRVLKPDGWLSLVFSNSSGAMWALVQRAVADAGFAIDADQIVVLDKGQRSVKGLASGFENVVTADLILSMRKASEPATIRLAPKAFLDGAIDRAVAGKERDTPTHVYLGVVREYLRHDYDMGAIDMAHIAEHLAETGYTLDPARGTLNLVTAPS